VYSIQGSLDSLEYLAPVNVFENQNLVDSPMYSSLGRRDSPVMNTLASHDSTVVNTPGSLDSRWWVHRRVDYGYEYSTKFQILSWYVFRDQEKLFEEINGYEISHDTVPLIKVVKVCFMVQ
jgi:hypothetical protein